VKSSLVAIYLIFGYFSIIVCAQTGDDRLTYTAKDILPHLQPYKLDALAKAVHKRDDLSAKEVKISLGNAWDILPFVRFRVEDQYVLFQSSDEHWFVFCPCEPPMMEQLSKARTLDEVMEMLAPAAKTSPSIRKFAMDAGTMLDNLNSKLSYSCDFHTAYLVRGRLMWIRCTLYYPENDKPKTRDTPFSDSYIIISLSPVVK